MRTTKKYPMVEATGENTEQFAIRYEVHAPMYFFVAPIGEGVEDVAA